MATIGSLTYSLVAKTDQFKQGLAGSSRALRDQRKLFLSTRTPAEAYGVATDRLGMQLTKGHISQEVYNRSLRKASIEFGRTGGAAVLYSGNLVAMRTALSNNVIAQRVAMSSVIAFGGALADIVRQTNQFQQSLAESTAIMSDVTERVRSEMTDTALHIAFNTKFAADEAAKAYFFLASAGLDAAQSTKAVGVTAQFAQAGNFDLAQATDLLTDAQSAFGLSVKNATANMDNMIRVSDVLVRANTLANATVEQFSTSLTNKAGASLKVLGKDIEEGVAVLAAFADQGIKAEKGGTALAVVLRNLTTQAIRNNGAFEKLGVTVFDANGEMRNIAAIVRDLEQRLAGLSDAQQKATLLTLGFTDKTITFTQALIGASGKIAAYEEQLRNASGFTEDVAGKTLTEYNRQWQQLGATWEAFSMTVGPVLLDLLVGTQKTMSGAQQSAGLFAKTLATVADVFHTLGLVAQRSLIPVKVTIALFNDGMRAAQNTFLIEQAKVHKAFLDDTPGQQFLKQMEDIRRGLNTTATDAKGVSDAIENLNNANAQPDLVSPEVINNADLLRDKLQDQIDALNTGVDPTRSGVFVEVMRSQRELAEEMRTAMFLGNREQVQSLENRIRELNTMERQLAILEKRNAKQEEGKRIAERAEAAAKREVVELTRRAEQLREKFATPTEKLRSDLSEIRELFTSGALDKESAFRALKDTATRFQEIRGAGTARAAPGTVQAIRAGSVEALRLQQRQMTGAPEERTAKNTEQIAKAMLQQLQVLRAIADRDRESEPELLLADNA